MGHAASSNALQAPAPRADMGPPPSGARHLPPIGGLLSRAIITTTRHSAQPSRHSSPSLLIANPAGLDTSLVPSGTSSRLDANGILLQTQLAAQQQRADRFQDEAQVLRARVCELEERVLEVEVELSDARREASVAQDEVWRLDGKLSSMQYIVENYKREAQRANWSYISEQQVSAEAHRQVEQKDDENYQLHMKIQQLTEEVQHQAAQLSELRRYEEDAQRQVVEARQDFQYGVEELIRKDDLMRQVRREHAADIAALQSEMQRLLVTNQACEDGCKTAHTQLAHLQALVGQLEGQLASTTDCDKLSSHECQVGQMLAVDHRQYRPSEAGSWSSEDNADVPSSGSNSGGLADKVYDDFLTSCRSAFAPLPPACFRSVAPASRSAQHAQQEDAAVTPFSHPLFNEGFTMAFPFKEKEQKLLRRLDASPARDQHLAGHGNLGSGHANKSKVGQAQLAAAGERRLTLRHLVQSMWLA